VLARWERFSGQSAERIDRTAGLVADLVEPAKAETLEKLGEGRQSLEIAASWVCSKLTPPAPVNNDLATLSPLSREEAS
jgi:serine kinase of HPr protein (carbohydrate metabolism regulator)